MLTDYHCHLLPQMDDGARDADTAVQMLALLRRQGVGQVVATPHFYLHREDPSSFLARREQAFSLLCSRFPGAPACVRLGAEVRIERGLCQTDRLERLSLGGSKYLLLELPYTAFHPWMAEEIYNVSYQFCVTPVLAHLDRYTQWYHTREIEQLLSIPGAVIQLNNESLFSRKTLKFALALVRAGRTVVFGSDAHNLEDRAPDFDRANAILQSKLKEQEYMRLLGRNSALLA